MKEAGEAISRSEYERKAEIIEARSLALTVWNQSGAPKS
jgi:hypothetical protein